MILTLLLLLSCSSVLAGDVTVWQAKLSQNTTTFALHGPADAGFQLFTPTGEKAWAGEAWDPRRVDGATAPDNEGMVFHNGVSQPLWIVSRYAPAERVVEYVIVTDSVLTRLHCGVVAVAPQESKATVTYTWTALSPSGNEYVEKHAAHFDAIVADWEKSMNRVLAGSK